MTLKVRGGSPGLVGRRCRIPVLSPKATINHPFRHHGDRIRDPIIGTIENVSSTSLVHPHYPDYPYFTEKNKQFVYA